MARKCSAEHPTLDLKCDQSEHPASVAHTATDADGNPHAWVIDTEPAE